MAAADRQRILDACRELSNHLVSWHDQLLAVVRSRDLEGMNNYRARIDDYMTMLNKTKGGIEQFKKGDHYEGPLDQILLIFESEGESSSDARQFANLVRAVKEFQHSALVFKNSEVDEIRRILDHDGHWSRTAVEDARTYNEQIDQYFESVETAYKSAMSAIKKVAREYEQK